jgi:predicted metalloprotease
MADWDKISSRGNVEDRRSWRGVGRVGGGLSVGSILLVVAINYLTGGNLGDVLNTLGPQLQQVETTQQQPDSQYAVFSSAVLGSANDLWQKEFDSLNKKYVPPKFVLFRDVTESECGGADAAVGPHYCPLDQTIYLDEVFFDVLQERLGVEKSDVGQAYVIAHEVGHHVQNQMGWLANSRQNTESIRTELQADCFAGLWARSIQERNILEVGEIKEAMDEVAGVGDDRIQKRTTGYISPEQWTHGSSAQRLQAFQKGFNGKNMMSCEN